MRATPPAQVQGSLLPNALGRSLRGLGARWSSFWTRQVLERLLLGPTIERLYLLLGGHIYFQTLSAAAELGLFTLLSRRGPLERGQIAAELGLQDKPVRILLLGCTALGLLRKRGTRYDNSLLARKALVAETPGNLLPILRWQHQINYQPMHAFGESLRANRNVGLEALQGKEETLYGRLARQPHLEAVFQEAMEAISVQANALLARYVDFSRIRRLIDVGGGNASNLIALARRHPHLSGAVFDCPSVCRIARQRIAEAGLAGRLEALEGDCFRDPFPRDADAYLFAHFLTIWSEEKNRGLLRKCREALPHNGTVLVFNMMQHDNGSGPLSAALGSPYFLTLATGEGMLYSWAEYEGWLREAGFQKVRRQALPRDHGAIIGTC